MFKREIFDVKFNTPDLSPSWWKNRFSLTQIKISRKHLMILEKNIFSVYFPWPVHGNPGATSTVSVIENIPWAACQQLRVFEFHWSLHRSLWSWHPCSAFLLACPRHNPYLQESGCTKVQRKLSCNMETWIKILTLGIQSYKIFTKVRF